MLGALAAGPGNSRIAVWTERPPDQAVADTAGPTLAAVRGIAAPAWSGPEAVPSEPAFPGFAQAGIDLASARALVLVPTKLGLGVAIRDPAL